MIIVNWKNYDIKKYDFFSFLEEIKELRMRYNYKLKVAVPHSFLYLSKDYDFIIAQDVTYKKGSFTGENSINSLEYFSKIDSTLLNHSEKERSFNDLINTIKVLNDKKVNCIVCASNKWSALALNSLNISSNLLNLQYIAYEPPELIGGSISVSKANPQIIKELSENIDNLLVGAGIKDLYDFKKSLELGAKGVLVASGVVKNKNRFKLLEEWITNI